MGRLQGKRALVTGGTSGIGLETAKQFLAEGAQVAVTGTNPKTIAAAKAEFGLNALVVEADSGSVADQKRTVEEVKQAFGGLDVLFVNAGIGDFRPLGAFDEAAFDRSFAVNVKGPYFLVQALLPLFGNPASIVLNTSINAHIGMPNSSLYSATKGALLTLVRTLSGELIGRGIRVNAVSPGPIATPLYGKLGMDEATLKALISLIPAKRQGTPSEVARAVVHLASDESAFTVGAELTIDGGMSTL
jgi:NAD(P)-dependent dehydrogenase (short-subunit alcohol dehydrogenase family)